MKQMQSIKQMTWIPKKYYVMKEKKNWRIVFSLKGLKETKETK